MNNANSQAIPDLWPQEIVFTPVLSPITILRHQAKLLGEKSKGVLEAEVKTGADEFDVNHELRLIAPALDNYSRPLLTVQHSAELPYPCKIWSPQFGTRTVESPDALMKQVAEALGGGTTRTLINSLLARIGEQTEQRKTS